MSKQFIDENDFDFTDGEEDIVSEKKPTVTIETPSTFDAKPVLQTKEIEENPYKNRTVKQVEKQPEEKPVSLVSQPVSQIKEEISVEKVVKNPPTKNQGGKRGRKKISNKESSKKLFSISNKYKDVNRILKDIGKTYSSESEYICKAIQEKYARDKNEETVDLKSKVKEALDELIGEKYIVIKGSENIAVGTNQPIQNIQTPVITQESVDTVIDEQVKEEMKDEIKNIFDGW